MLLFPGNLARVELNNRWMDVWMFPIFIQRQGYANTHDQDVQL